GARPRAQAAVPPGPGSHHGLRLARQRARAGERPRAGRGAHEGRDARAGDISREALRASRRTARVRAGTYQPQDRRDRARVQHVGAAERRGQQDPRGRSPRDRPLHAVPQAEPIRRGAGGRGVTQPGAAAPDEPSRARRIALEAAAVGLLVIGGHLLFRLSREFMIGALNDDGVYVVLGKAIAQGDGYRSIHLVGAPLQVRYPPALPLLLAVPWALAGTLGAVPATVAVLHPMVTGAAAGLVWWLGRDRLELSPAP